MRNLVDRPQEHDSSLQLNFPSSLADFDTVLLCRVVSSTLTLAFERVSSKFEQVQASFDSGVQGGARGLATGLG